MRDKQSYLEKQETHKRTRSYFETALLYFATLGVPYSTSFSGNLKKSPTQSYNSKWTTIKLYQIRPSMYQQSRKQVGLQSCFQW
jgi:hypothetical protein